MKKKILPLLAGLLVFFAACSKKDNTVAITPDSVNNTVVSGSWRVTYFFDSNKDETSGFNGFVFVFLKNGYISASNNLLSISGSWIATSNATQIQLQLNFNTSSNSNFLKISEDWGIIELTNTKIRMQHISSGSTDYLTLEKN